MDKNEQLQVLPTTRIKPVDGMAVTADVWEEAHDYHLRSGRGHAALLHGSGIVAGLEVIASDPADTAVYIKPGVAVVDELLTAVVDEKKDVEEVNAKVPPIKRAWRRMLAGKNIGGILLKVAARSL